MKKPYDYGHRWVAKDETIICKNCFEEQTVENKNSDCEYELFFGDPNSEPLPAYALMPEAAFLGVIILLGFILGFTYLLSFVFH